MTSTKQISNSPGNYLKKMQDLTKNKNSFSPYLLKKQYYLKIECMKHYNIHKYLRHAQFLFYVNFLTFEQKNATKNI